LQTVTFHSSDMPAADAFGLYHDLYRDGSDVSRADGPFFADIIARQYPRMIVFDRRLAGVGHERTARRVISDGFDHIMLQLVLDGSMVVFADGMVKTLQAGDLVVFDLQEAQRTLTAGCRIATVSIARDIVLRNLPFPKISHGRVFPAGAAPLLCDVICSLLRFDAAADQAMANAATLSVGMLTGALLASGVEQRRTGATNEQLKLKVALDHIAANIARLDLCADSIAQALAVSRSVLYRVFEPLGGVARCIRRQRLLALRKALVYPSETRSIAVLARQCGFVSDAHANRSFRAEFGMAPGEFRCNHADRAASGAKRASEEKPSIAHLFAELV
jgi:AraC-like DNA-binding protein